MEIDDSMSNWPWAQHTPRVGGHSIARNNATIDSVIDEIFADDTNPLNDNNNDNMDNNNNSILFDSSLRENYNNNNNLYHHSPTRGDLWISKDRKMVEWSISNHIIKRFQFYNKEKNSIVLKAGFIDFEYTKDCLIILLNDFANVYYLNNNNDMITINYPFTISNVFWYSKGIILERKLNNNNIFEKNHRFIVLNDPMAPFGLLEFSMNQKLEFNINDLQLMVFPKNNLFNISIFYETPTNQLHFFYTKISTTTNNNNISLNTKINSNISSSILKPSINNDSIQDSDEATSFTQRFTSNGSRRSISINFDPSSLASPLAETNVNNNNNHNNNIGNNSNFNINELPKIDVRSPSYPLMSPYSNNNIDLNIPQHETNSNVPITYNNYNISSKDVTLTRISTLTLPKILKNNNTLLKLLPLILDNKEIIVIFDDYSKFSKIWFINLLPNIINFYPFKVYGESPKDMIGLSNINILNNNNNSMNNDVLKIRNIFPYICQNAFYENTVVIEYQSKNDLQIFLCLYNPFISIPSPFIKFDYNKYLSSICNISSEHIILNKSINESNSNLTNLKDINDDVDSFTFTSPFIFPKQGLMLKIFNALKLICSNDIYFCIIVIWQSIFNSSLDETWYDPLLINEVQFNIFKKIIIFLINLKDEKLLNSISNSSSNSNIKHSRALSYLSNSNKKNYLPQIIMGLHLLNEEFKLNVLNNKDVQKLTELLYISLKYLNWGEIWINYYKDSKQIDYTNLENYYQFETIDEIENFSKPLEEPPSILKSLYSITECSNLSITPFITFSRLVGKDFDIDELITPRTSKLLKLYDFFHANKKSSPEQLLKYLELWKIDKYEIETYPLGIMVPLEAILENIQYQLSTINEDIDLSLINRIDLNTQIQTIKNAKYYNQNTKQFEIQNNQNQLFRNSNLDNNSKLAIQKKLYSNQLNQSLTSSSSNNSKPKDIYSVLTDIIRNTPTFKDEKSNSKINSAINSYNINNLAYDSKDDDIDEGQILKKNSNIIFSQDKRFSDALNLLIYYKPHNIYFFSKSREYTKLLKKKKLFAKNIALRTCTNGIGWGAIVYATEKPLSTQRWQRPHLNLVSLFSDGTKISLEPSDIDDIYYQWGEFHGGVSSGLRISRKATNIDGSWITFNKPLELDSQHGGFLLGLGLNGHLKELEEWHVYNYLSLKNNLVSIGLLLGMSASLKGTMDIKLTKVLSVHIVALLPPGSTDLNIDLKVQTAGLVGVGLLYQGSSHKRMSNLFYNQLSSLLLIKDEQVADEGYRMAAGIALGLINLGTGKRRFLKKRKKESKRRKIASTRNTITSYNSFASRPRVISEAGLQKPSPIFDSSINNIIDDSSTGSTSSSSSSSSDEDDISTKSTSDTKFNELGLDKDIENGLLRFLTQTFDTEREWIPENSQIGVTLAIILIYVQSNDLNVATQVRPKNILKLSNVQGRPELYMYRELTYYMIMWDLMGQDLDFVLKGFDSVNITGITTDNLPLYYIIAGRVLAMGIKYSSSGELKIRDTLIKICDIFLPFYQYAGDGSADFRMAIAGINMIMNVAIVSMGLIMCGTGDLSTFRRIRYLHEVVTGNASDLFRRVDEAKKVPDKNADGDVEIDIDEPSIDGATNEEGSDTEAEIDYGDDNIKKALNSDKIPIEHHYGKYMATNLALGFLFLGSGQYALKTSDVESIAYILLSVLPIYMPNYPLQELKHFWSMAVEPRCLVLRDVLSGDFINSVPVNISLHADGMKSTTSKTFYPPCLLPDIRKIASIKIDLEDYYPFEIQFSNDLKPVDYFKNGTVIHIQKKEFGAVSHENRFGLHVDNLETSLRKKIEGHETSIDRIKASTSIKDIDILHPINFNDIIMTEVDTYSKLGTSSPDKVHTDYNINLLSSTYNLGSSDDMRLELWKRTHLK
ncbi:hypothetical protein TBLA_0B00830 [Henningerozyma blattae CBS 6284]|uniref:Uncharacterized protein n=1 Tax=Henningerozyma blattae (strain ATCC 34711 / CBS 6284 / DSM 70876 / NBRC 10599 / NRRL Y-10934 / UCD 77-7) TaxID=1071380 RepID=I2GXS4_HENB6|nr:hypothetical protein TBLA_0B00830 [Tetrapisispora blattae CBS 6284]CCH58926.1 hypothetical protein TBLA_0B00830 [Tetrapisispora blattae CBS 6284]